MDNYEERVSQSTVVTTHIHCTAASSPPTDSLAHSEYQQGAGVSHLSLPLAHSRVFEDSCAKRGIRAPLRSVDVDHGIRHLKLH
jgi:hypothetical protein